MLGSWDWGVVDLRPHPESNGDAREGRGFEPRAIPLCDVGA